MGSNTFTSKGDDTTLGRKIIMIKKYQLGGLGCASCGDKIERGMAKVDGVVQANVSFATSTLQLETGPAYKGDIDADVLRVVHTYEPDVKVTDKDAPKNKEADEHGHSHDHGHSHGEESGTRQLVLLISGAAVFVLGIFLRSVLELNGYVELAIFVVAYILLGGSVVIRAIKNITRGQIFDENFLMTVANIGAFALGDYAEGVAVMLFYQVGEFFQDMAVRRSKKSITDLMDIRPDYANVQRGGELVKVAPDTVATGDIIVVKPGEKVPLDGKVLTAESILDTSAFTGESVPCKVSATNDLLVSYAHLGAIRP